MKNFLIISCWPEEEREGFWVSDVVVLIVSKGEQRQWIASVARCASSKMLQIVLQLGLALTLAVTSTTFALESPHINLPSLGGLIGSIDYTAWNNHIIYQFQAIPYALPPSGHRRFKVFFCFGFLMLIIINLISH